MSVSLPVEALGVSILVFAFSVGCLILSTLLVCLLISYGERSKYVTVFSAFTVLSTFASLIQQIHFIANWKTLRLAHYQQTLETYQQHGIAFGGAGETWDVLLFYFQFYCYNVMTLNILFWAVSLFNSSWACTFSQLGGRHHNLAILSKLFSVIWPGFIVGILQLDCLQHQPLLHVILTYSTIFFSLSLGGILLILILFKYMRTRKLAAESAIEDDWWAPSESDDVSYQDNISENYGKISPRQWYRKRSIYDRALVTRFTIGFVIMGVFEVVIVILMCYRAKSNEILVKSGSPDMSASNAIIESLLFLPGVSTSLMAFLVFGTTKSWRNYRDLVLGICRRTRDKTTQLDKRGYRIRVDEKSNTPFRM